MLSVTLVAYENHRHLILRKDTGTYVFRYQSTLKNIHRLQDIMFQYAARDDLDFTWDDIEAIAIHMQLVSQITPEE